MAVLCVLLTATCCFDYRYKKIPNHLIFLVVVMGAFWRFRQGGTWGVLSYIGEAVLVMCLLYPLFKVGMVGAGDVKLLGVSAGYFPLKKILIFLFMSLLIAAVVSLVKMMKKRYFLERIEYFLDYLREVVKSGRFKLYLQNEQDRGAVGICLSGPVLVSVLLYMGGVYLKKKLRK